MTASPTKEQVLESLVAYGAPLVAWRPAVNPLAFEETFVRALVIAHQNATVLRVVPMVLARHEGASREGLATWAGALHQEAALGMVIDLLEKGAAFRFRALRDQLQQSSNPEVIQYFFEDDAASERAMRLADLRTPQCARAWGLRLNMPVEAFKRA